MWWLLGLFQIMFFIAALWMAVKMLRGGPIRAPKRFAIWAVFLVWIIGGLLTLQVDAPGAVAGDSLGRYITYFYRYAWYLTSTITLLYVYNTRRTLDNQRIVDAIGWFFVVLVGGGLLGTLASSTDFPSALEIVLPSRITQIPLAFQLIHPNLAQVQSILGESGARPSAPFAFTNEWGMAVAVTFPFFVYSWWNQGVPKRVAMALVLILSTFPIVASLNRGLWLALAATAVFALLRSAFLGNIKTLVPLGFLTVAVAAAVVATPLGSTIVERVNTPHSDAGRANLSSATVESALQGSPVVGFGSTRDVAGNFGSIAGGASAACPGCESPPLGTHGQAWLLIFTTGFGGFMLYVVFVGSYLLSHLRSTAGIAGPACATLLTTLFTMPIYGANGVSSVIIFAGIGLLARLDEEEPNWNRRGTLADAAHRIHRGRGFVAAGLAAGALGGLAFHYAREPVVEATQSVLVPSIDLVSEPDARDLTLDNEAALALSVPVGREVADAASLDSVTEALERLSLSARPNTRVLVLTYAGKDAASAQRGVTAAVDGFLSVRSDLRLAAIQDTAERQRVEYEQLDRSYAELHSVLAEASFSSDRTSTLLDMLRATVAELGNSLDTDQPSTNVGGAISEVSVTKSSDSRLVFLASGAIPGVVLGLIAAYWLARVGGNGRGRGPRFVQGLIALDFPADIPTQKQARIVESLHPLAVVVSDLDDRRASWVANDLEAVRATTSSSDRRALLVVSQKLTLDRTATLIAQCRAVRLEPVALVVVGEHPR